MKTSLLSEAGWRAGLRAVTGLVSDEGSNIVLNDELMLMVFLS
ncbi:hypothetical protein EJF13_RS22445 [Escherichia coli]|nr:MULTISPECIES: hypothetical protein [Enterobacteriaceae]EFJ65629.1 hypothetical protein HMPREF9547_03171 [Escherichia coli MS 175-1]MCV0887625.1 hypothetical protein [Escherichia coli]MCV4840985.1 hypothetical protein [Escherichia coli]MCZ4170719.1 hypothetical protein [Escherichia coli]MDF0791889.1 hypothetical protein [Escherichia coli]